MIQKAQRVTHGTVRRFGHIPDRLIFHIHLLCHHQLLKSGRNRLDTDPLKVIMLAPRENRNGYLVHLRGCQYKDDILRRLLQRLQERIKSAYGKHMHLVYDVDLIPALRRAVRHLLPDLPDVIHTIVGSSVNLNHIHRRPRRD